MEHIETPPRWSFMASADSSTRVPGLPAYHALNWVAEAVMTAGALSVLVKHTPSAPRRASCWRNYY